MKSVNILQRAMESEGSGNMSRQMQFVCEDIMNQLLRYPTQPGKENEVLPDTIALVLLAGGMAFMKYCLSIMYRKKHYWYISAQTKHLIKSNKPIHLGITKINGMETPLVTINRREPVSTLSEEGDVLKQMFTSYIFGQDGKRAPFFTVEVDDDFEENPSVVLQDRVSEMMAYYCNVLLFHIGQTYQISDRYVMDSSILRMKYTDKNECLWKLSIGTAESVVADVCDESRNDVLDMIHKNDHFVKLKGAV